jgi:hypothetical protein
MTEPARTGPTLPAIPLLVFAAIDVALAFFLLVDGGFTGAFFIVAVIGVVLALAGWFALRRGL